jgi:hypothetical protein
MFGRDQDAASLRLFRAWPFLIPRQLKIDQLGEPPGVFVD